MDTVNTRYIKTLYNIHTNGMFLNANDQMALKMHEVINGFIGNCKNYYITHTHVYFFILCAFVWCNNFYVFS